MRRGLDPQVWLTRAWHRLEAIEEKHNRLRLKALQEVGEALRAVRQQCDKLEAEKDRESLETYLEGRH